MASRSDNNVSTNRASCLSCHRRKLKCSREPGGCENCRRNDDSCTYPAPETRARQKRGPYQKSKSRREHDLENAVKAIEKKYEELAAQMNPSNMTAGSKNVSTSSPDGQSSISANSPANDAFSNASNLRHTMATRESTSKDSIGCHPPTSQMMDHWHLYSTKVDPLIKILHRPSFGKIFFAAQGNASDFDSGLQALLFSIYFASVTSLTSEEAQSRFGQSRDRLLENYQFSFEACLIAEQAKRRPSIFSLQGLVIYLICLRRQDGENRLWSLFGLALRMAQLMGIDSESDNQNVPFFEGQMRRRLWWHLCWLEKRYAEDRMSEPASIMDWSDVMLPYNLNDTDLDPDVTLPPQPRVGFTDMTMSLIRFEIVKVGHELTNTLSNHAGEDQMTVFAKKASLLDEVEARINQQHLQFCDKSRPFDRVVLSITNVLLLKGKLIVQKSLNAATPMANHEEGTFKICLDILKRSYNFQNDRQLDEWRWIYRDSVQIPSLLQVASMLGQQTGRNLDPAIQQEALALCEESFSRLPEPEKQSQRGSQLLALVNHARQAVFGHHNSPITTSRNIGSCSSSDIPLVTNQDSMPRNLDSSTNSAIVNALPIIDSTDPMLEEFDWDELNSFLDHPSFSLGTF